MLSSQTNDDGSRISQSDLRSNSRPATQRWTLQVKEEKNTAKEAFDGTALAQFLFGPSGRQTGSIFLPLGIPRNDGHGTKHSMNPGNEA